jgi:flagellin
MPQVISTNIFSLNAQRNLNSSQNVLQTSLQRLSSGLRINSAKDDAAGLAISERFTSQIRGLEQAARNANDGISLAQTGEGALQETGNLLQRIRELSVQAANSTNSASDRAALQAEVNQAKAEIDRIANTTEFNGTKLLDSTFTAQSFQVGANANQTIDITIAGARTIDLAQSSVAGVNSTANHGTGGVGVGAGTASAANLSTATNTIGAQNLTISGIAGQQVVAIAGNQTANAVAAAVNAVTDKTGVTAQATNRATIGNLSASGTVSLNLSSSGTAATLGSQITISASVTTSDLSALATEINKHTGQTGITAKANGSSIELTQAQGYDIQIENFANSANGTVGITGGDGAAATTLTSGAATDSTIIAGTVTFDSNSGFTISSDVAANAGSIFNAAANALQSSAQSNVSSIDISSSAGAQSALKVIDAALATISDIRASLGAFQNRFESTIRNLSTTSENLSASRSRIRDADFAQETANLTRAQILQQAGTAILAQANAVPQNVLSLLR